jgi:hypothetical protein
MNTFARTDHQRPEAAAPTRWRFRLTAATTARLASILGPGLLGIAMLGFLALKAFALRAQVNDDGIYFYAAARLAGGAVPHRDFFFAHPTLHLVPTAAAFALVGYQWWLGKTLVFALAAMQGVCVYLSVRRLIRDHTSPLAREAAAVLACLLLLGSETFLVASSDDTGLVQSSAWLSLAVALVLHGRPIWSGVFAGAAAMTSLQICPLVVALALGAFLLAPRPKALRLALAAAAVVALVHAAGIALAGRAFIDQVYGFHLAKPPMAGEGARELVQLVRHNGPLFIAALAGVAALGTGEGRPRTLALVIATGLALFLLAMVTRPRVFYWYFLPALAPAAILGGLALAFFFETMKPSRREEAAALPPRWWALSLAGGAALLLLVGQRPAGALRSPHGEAVRYERRTAYEWIDAPVLGPLNRLIRWAWWHDGRRDPPGARHNPFTEYLWRQSSWLDSLPAMTAAVQSAARADPLVSLFGDYGTVPLLALEAGVPVTGDFIDTTGQRFRAGAASFDQVARLLDSDPHALVLLRTGGSGVNARAALRGYLDSHFETVQVFRSRAGVEHTLYRPLPASRPPAPR